VLARGNFSGIELSTVALFVARTFCSFAPILRGSQKRISNRSEQAHHGVSRDTQAATTL
jgi:hypothetical protein